ncbi:Prophage CP4-57 integrase [compost metagenome]
MKPRATEKASERALSDDEIKRVWAAIEQLSSTEPEHVSSAEAARDILKLTLLTAQRGGEVKSMAWKELDLEAGWWSIPSSRAKNARSHRVPLSGPALDILKIRKAQADTRLATHKAIDEEAKPEVWVFPGRGAENEGHVTEIKKAIANARKSSGCDWTPHDLRRTASTGMGKLNILPSTISRVLNHKDADVPDVTWVYLQYQYDAAKRQALDAWAKKLSGILTGI